MRSSSRIAGASLLGLAVAGWVMVAWVKLSPPAQSVGAEPAAEKQVKTDKPDLEGVRQVGKAYADAFNKGDLKALVALFDADGEYIDDAGTAVKGRDQIAALFQKALPSWKGLKMAVKVSQVKFLTADVAAGDGTVELTDAHGKKSHTPFNVLLVRKDNRWLLSLVRDLPNSDSEEGADEKALEELGWLIGEWVPEDRPDEMKLVCRWDLNKHFLVQEFSVKQAEGEPFQVRQYIGWDPLNDQLKSIVFDSLGGVGKGYWTRTGTTWEIETGGITLDGRVGSATHICKWIDHNKFRWQARDREVDGEPAPDWDVTFIRKPAKK